MEQVRTAVIGYGGMGRQYAQMISQGKVPGMVLAGICCRNQAGQEEIRTQYPQAKIYHNIKEVFAGKEELDAVLIVTPHSTHVPIGKEAFSHGLSVLCDKPVGVDTREVKELIRASEDAGKALAVMFNVRTKPAYQKAREMMKDGSLGKITRAVWVCNSWYRSPFYHRSSPWRSTWRGEQGGLLINQCQHFLDIWQWLFGMPQSLYASIDFGKYNDFTVDDSVDIQFFYENGLRGTFISASGEAPGVNRLEIWGSKGRLTIENNEILTFDQNEMSTEEFGAVNKEIFGAPGHHLEKIDLKPETEAYETMLQNFADHLLSGEPLIADGVDGLHAVELSNAAYLSAWTDKKITLPADETLFEKLLTEHMENESIRS